jgi:hypothetical protein
LDLPSRDTQALGDGQESRALNLLKFIEAYRAIDCIKDCQEEGARSGSNCSLT